MKNFTNRMLFTGALTILCGLIAALAHSTFFALIGTLPLVFILPGLGVLQAVDPRDRMMNLRSRAFWAVAGSLAIDVLGGLLLNEIASLDRRSWAIFLVIVAGGGLTVGLIRNGRMNRHASCHVSPPIVAANEEKVSSIRNDAGGNRVSRRTLTAFAIALALVVGAIAISQNSVTATNPNFLQLWVVPQPLETGSFANVATVGLTNLAASQMNLNLQVREGTQRVGRIFHLELKTRTHLDKVPGEGTVKAFRGFGCRGV